MCDRAIASRKAFQERARPVMHLWDLDLDTQIARLQVLNRSEAELARAIRVMIGPSGSRNER